MMRELVNELMSDGVLKTPEIIQAFLHIDRADFLPPGMKSFAYSNEPVPIGYGQTMSQPWTVAFMLELLGPKESEQILDIGSGSSWQTALLSFIVSHDSFGNELPSEKWGRVIGIELIPELAQMGRKSIFSYNFIKKGIAEIHCLNAGSGFPGWAPYDKIIAAATGVSIPDAWKKQLKEGGILVAPVRSKIVRLQKKEGDAWGEEEFPGFAFVPFIPSDENS